MFVSKNIRFLRTSQKLTQIDLAKVLGRTSAVVSDYEKGKATPSLEITKKISEFFNVSIDDLVNEDLQMKDALSRTGFRLAQEPDLREQYKKTEEQLEEKIRTLERLNTLQEQRLSDLEWMICKHAPELAREIGLLDKPK